MYYFPSDGFDSLFIILFGVILFAIVLRLVSGFASINAVNESPMLSVRAKVVSKRINVSVHPIPSGDNGISLRNTTHTEYFTTFEFDSGDRTEFLVDGREYGLIREGDVGMLTFKGPKFIRFERIVAA